MTDVANRDRPLTKAEHLYRERLALHRAAAAALARRSTAISLARLVVFVLGVAALATALFSPTAGAGYAAGVFAIVFAALVFWHAAVTAREARAAHATLFCERGLARIAGELTSLPPRGARFASSTHAYAGDLDLLGAHSVMQLLDAIDSDASEERLAQWLLRPSPVAEACVRQAAVRELADLPLVRESFFVCARTPGADDHARTRFLAWCAAPPEGEPGVVVVAAAFLFAMATLAIVVFGHSLHIPTYVTGLLYVVGLVANHLVGGRAERALTAASAGARLAGGYGESLRIVVATPWASPPMRGLAEGLGHDRARAPEALARIGRIADFAEARQNGFFRLFVAPFVVYDVFLAFFLGRWRRAFGSHAGRWFDALAETHALAGLGTFAFENPGYAFPDLRDDRGAFEAAGLAHPLLPPNVRVANDVALQGPGSALLVTGSNMAGKSTLLRSMGVAIVLARAGAPVCASSLVVSGFVLGTSMRVSDSLASGVSHFYAELLALKRVVDATKGPEPVCFLLDEILHGTNSRERHIGAKSVIAYLLAHGAMGAVSTHDLALAELADESAGRVRTVHLRELAEGATLVFDYRLRDGLVRSGNALRLMQTLGLPVGDEARSSVL